MIIIIIIIIIILIIIMNIINNNNNLSRSSYPAFSSPAAFVPHSAINLSVKTNEEGPHSAEPSPQILDLTRPLR